MESLHHVDGVVNYKDHGRPILNGTIKSSKPYTGKVSNDMGEL